MIGLPFFLLLYTYLFVPKWAVLLTLVLGLLWDLFLVLPLGVCETVFSLFLLFLDLYQRKYSAVNPLFMFLYLAGATIAWLYWFQGSIRVGDVALFLVVFLGMLMVVRKEHDLQKHFV